MSVRVADRNDSIVEYLNTAHELELFSTRAVSNEKVIPKRYRFTLGRKILDHVQNINTVVIYADRCKDAELKKSYLKEALISIDLLYARLRIAYELLQIRTPTIDEWARLITKEEDAVHKAIARIK